VNHSDTKALIQRLRDASKDLSMPYHHGRAMLLGEAADALETIASAAPW
jgi:hypothetical protein